MLVWFLFAAAAATPSLPGCAGVDGWIGGHQGEPARKQCGADYEEAHRLGQAVHALKREHAELTTLRLGATAEQVGPLQRRQRQLEIDLEAIRGVATTQGWPLDIAPEITP